MRDPATTGQPTPVENGASTPSGAPPPVHPEQVWFSLSFFNVHSTQTQLRLCSHRHGHGGTATQSRPHGLTATRQQLFFFLLSSDLLRFFLLSFSSFFFSWLIWLRFCLYFSLLFSVLYNYLFNWQFVFFLVFIYFTVSVVSTLYTNTAHYTYQSQIGNLSFSYSLFILLFQYTAHFFFG